MLSEDRQFSSAKARQPATRRPVAAILENIRSAGNVGSMFRTADAALLEKLYLCGYTAHPPHPEMEKTALGAADSVPWEFWGRAGKAVEWLQAQEYMVIALEQTPRSLPLEILAPQGRTAMDDGGQSLWRYPLAFVVGNEVEGVSDAVLERCDLHLHIPMLGTKDSLNVAVAFGIAAFALASSSPEA
jgi:tRNA G18 (ribose-2'-O)-methylase SpoU